MFENLTQNIPKTAQHFANTLNFSMFLGAFTL